MATETQYSDILANVVMGAVAYVARLLFGDDHLTKKQGCIVFLCLCSWIWIVSLLDVSRALGGGLSMFGGFVIVSVIKGIITGSKKSEKNVSKTTSKALDSIADKIEGVTDAVMKNKDDDKK